MAKNFGKAGSVSAFGAVAKVEQEKAQVIVLQNISNENLIDNPKNGEDIIMTGDLEESMRQNGFTDPIEVTDFNMESGKYMILSGHRRRAAGVKVGITVFPCVVRHFKNEQEVQNYTLMANSQRDSAKDPCLFCGRYKMHEEYLESVGFKGNKREEIAKRLGISIQQADRYNAMNRVVLPVWDMVRAEVVGMSSVLPLAPHTEDEQMEIYNIMQEALASDVSLTRDTVKKIVDGYRDGKRTWADVEGVSRGLDIPLDGFMNTEPGVTKEPVERNRNDEVRREYDPIGDEYINENTGHTTEVVEDEREDDVPEGKNKGGNNESAFEEKELKLGIDIHKQLNKLENSLDDIWGCADEKAAKKMVNDMNSVIRTLIDEMYRITEEWDMKSEFKNSLSDIAETVSQYE